MILEEVALTAITPYSNNARDNRNTIEKVEASILKYGFKVPLVLDENYVIVTGHTRYEALKRIYEATGKYETVPCYILKLDEDLIKEYRIVDNKISDLSEWDNDKLTSELKSFASEKEILEEFSKAVSNRVEQSTGAGIQEITKEEYKGKEEQLASRYEDKVSAFSEEFVSIRCDKCGEEFDMKKKDIF